MQLNPNEKLVLRALAENPEGMSWRSVAIACDVSSESGARDLIKRLVSFRLAWSNSSNNFWKITPKGVKLVKKWKKDEIGTPIKLF